MEDPREYGEYVHYQWSYTPITGPFQVQKKPVCSTVVFVNQGNTVAYINDQLRLLPNQSFTFEGYPGEVNVHNFTISFLNGSASGAVNNVLMVTKNYPKK